MSDGDFRFTAILGLVTGFACSLILISYLRAVDPTVSCDDDGWVAFDGWALNLCKGQLVALDYQRSTVVVRDVLLPRRAEVLGATQSRSGSVLAILGEQEGRSEAFLLTRSLDRLSPVPLDMEILGVRATDAGFEVATTNEIVAIHGTEPQRARPARFNATGRLVSTTFTAGEWRKDWLIDRGGEQRIVRISEHGETMDDQLFDVDSRLLAEARPMFPSTGLVYRGNLLGQYRATDPPRWTGPCRRRTFAEQEGGLDFFDLCFASAPPILDTAGREVTPSADLRTARVVSDKVARTVRLRRRK